MNIVEKRILHDSTLSHKSSELVKFINTLVGTNLSRFVEYFFLRHREGQKIYDYVNTQNKSLLKPYSFDFF